MNKNIKAGKLTDKQEMFCQEYMIDLNATQAAIRAGYSESTANRIGSENLSKLDIQQRVAELKDERLNKVQVDAQGVLQELLNWAYGDFTEFMALSADQVKKLPIEIRRLITGHKIIDKSSTDKEGNVYNEEVVELKFISKEKAMEMITKHIGFNELDNMQQNKDNVAKININLEGKKIDLSM